MTSPQFPRQKSLQGRIRFIYKCTTPGSTEFHGSLEIRRLLVVKNVAFAIICCRGTRWLISECGTTLYSLETNEKNKLQSKQIHWRLPVFKK